jgi:hypothetical protein
MGLVEEISSMKNQGFSEEEIIVGLREKGISPKEVQDAVNQLKIKNAVSEYEVGEERKVFAEQGGGWMQKTQEVPQQEIYPTQPPQEYNSHQQEYSPQEEYNPPQTYSSGIDSSTIIEISEQIFSEKIKPIKKELDSMNESKAMNQIRIENINERLQRIETMFDKLQIAILEKIGSYGQSLETVKKEMEMIQNSFTKIADPLVDRSEKIAAKKRYSKK